MSYRYPRIAIACNAPWRIGGQGKILYQTTEALKKSAEIVVCSNQGHRADNDSATKFYLINRSGLAAFISRVPILRRFKGWLVHLNDSHFDRELSARLDSFKGDLVIGVAGQCALTFKESSKKKIKLWLYCFNSYLDFMKKELEMENEILGDGVSEIHKKMIERFHEECKIADKIILLSNVAKKTFISAGILPEKLAVLYPSVETDRFKPAVKQDAVFRVLFIGTIEPRKGAHYLLEAFAKANLSNSELLLVGGTSTPKLKQLLNKYLKQYSNIKQEFWDLSTKDPTLLFGRCSVLALPSVEDGFGLVALEAMSSGLPVIVTKRCGVADIIQNGIHGFVISPRSVGEIIEKISFLHSEHAEYQRMAQQARLLAEQHSQDRLSADWGKILKENFV